MARYQLLKTPDADFGPLYTHLHDTLGAEVLAAVSVVATGGDLGGTESERVLALADFDEDMAKAVSEAIAAFGNASFRLTAEPLTLDPPAPVPAGDVLTEEEEARFPRSDMDLSKVLLNLLDGPATGQKFPEELYKGEAAKLHPRILKMLNKHRPIPIYQDAGRTISEADVNALKMPHTASKKAWDRIIGDLRSELRGFRYTKEYFGDSGHYRNFWRDQSFLNAQFLQFVNDKYLTVKESALVHLLLDAMIRSAGVLIGLSGPTGKFVAAGLQALFAFALKTGDARGKISGEIADLSKELANEFEGVITSCEKARVELNGDWGKLGAFSKLVSERTIQWPDLTHDMRAAASIAFQRTAFQALLPHFKYGYICWANVKASPHAKRKFDPKTGIYKLTTHAEYQGWLKGWWCRVYEMGGMVHIDMETYFEPMPKHVQEKLFGLNTHSAVDPQLKLPAGFYLKNPWKLKKVEFP